MLPSLQPLLPRGRGLFRGGADGLALGLGLPPLGFERLDPSPLCELRLAFLLTPLLRQLPFMPLQQQALF